MTGNFGVTKDRHRSTLFSRGRTYKVALISNCISAQHLLKYSCCGLFYAIVLQTPISHAMPERLSGDMVLGGRVFSSGKFSPDSSRIVYYADQETDNVGELYSVPLAGGAPIKLNATLSAVGDVRGGSNFQISPDGSRVVYIANQDTDDVFELYSVPLAGGTPIKLNGTMVEGGKIDGISKSGGAFIISSDSSYVVYRADQDEVGRFELYSVPLGGGTAVKLSGLESQGNGVVGEDVNWGFSITPDSKRAVYRIPYGAIYSVPLEGGTPTKLTPSFVTRLVQYDVSPDSSQVVFRLGRLTHELFSVPIEGGTPVKLNNPRVANSGRKIGRFAISPDSSRVVYIAEEDAIWHFELYSAPLDASVLPVKLNPTMVRGGDIVKETSFERSFWISPDSTRVVYEADQETNNLNEVFSVPLMGGTSVKLNVPSVGFGAFVRLTAPISPDSKWVVYEAITAPDSPSSSFSVPLAGGVSTRLSTGITQGGGISPDSNQVLFRSNQDTDGPSELYRVPIRGGTTVNLNVQLPGIDDTPPGFSLDGGRFVYTARPEGAITVELYSVILGGCTSPHTTNENALCRANKTGIQDWDTQAGSYPGITQTVIFPEASGEVTGAVLDLTGLTHTFLGDLSVELISPDGTSQFVIGQQTGLSPTGASSDYFGNYSFQDGAASLRTAADSNPVNGVVPLEVYAPSEDNGSNLEQINSFATTFAKKPAEGTWTVRFHDSNPSADSGHLASWRLSLLIESTPFVIPLSGGKAIVVDL